MQTLKEQPCSYKIGLVRISEIKRYAPESMAFRAYSFYADIIIPFRRAIVKLYSLRAEKNRLSGFFLFLVYFGRFRRIPEAALCFVSSILPEGFHHSQKVFNRNARLRVVDRVEYKSAARFEYFEPLFYFRPYLVRRAER